MKRATRRALEKWFVPGVLGGIVGGIVGSMGSVWSGEGFSLPQMWVLTVGVLLCMALTVYDMVRSDELERRIYFVGMTCAFVGGGAVAMVYGLLQMMGWPALNWGVFFPVLAVFYALGWWGAWLYYR
ncbi:MAG TPA: hypothetical protein VF263_25445 [Longimicrobiaceae bacterium]